MSSTTSGIQHSADTRFKMNVSIFYDHIANNQSDNFRCKAVMDAVTITITLHRTQTLTKPGRGWTLNTMQQPSFKTLPCCASRLAGRAEDSRVSLICVKLESVIRLVVLSRLRFQIVPGTKDLLKSLIVWTRTRNQWSFLLHLWHYYWVSARPGSAAAQGCLCRNINFCKVGLFLIVPL